MTTERDAALHLVALYDERVAMTKAMAQHERPTGQMADAILAKGAELDGACEEFRRKFYPRRHRVIVGLRSVFTVSKTGHTTLVLGGGAA